MSPHILDSLPTSSHGGGGSLVVIEDFPYVGVDFRGSADLVLLEGIQWEASGMKDHNLVTNFSCFLYVFGCTMRDLSHFVFIM
jgi:hypothetical protein